MKKAKRGRKMAVLFSLIGVVVVCIATVVLIQLYVSTPTKGTAIGHYDTPKPALLVIDIQKDYTGSAGAYGDTREFVGRINQAIACAEKSGMEILYVKNELSNPVVLLLSEGKGKAGADGAELDSGLLVVNDNIFSKSVGDGFSNEGLDEYLRANNVDTLYIVGLDASACVYSTARGGLNRGYEVNVIYEAIISVNDSTMNQALELYDKHSVGVIEMAEFIELASR